MLRKSIALVLGAAAAVVLAAAPADAASKPKFYVSLGDSYAAGYQPTGVGQGRTTRNGFAYQVPVKAAARGYDLKLVNFGCGGATTTSIITQKGCAKKALGPGGTAYDGRTQVDAAARFLKQHRGRVGLVTVSISGNDVTSCAANPDPVPCVTTAITTVNANLAKALKTLRKAAGKKVPIVGTTYPDVLLGLYPGGDASQQQLAQLSLVAFKSLLNPALKKAYEAVGGKFVDVTDASGSYVPFDQTTQLFPYGTVPVAVANICELSYYCAYHDIHLRTDGYALIADLVAKALPRKH
jgi:lysophospholipase L1-like esterase